MIVNVINTWVLELLWVMWVHSIRVCTTRPARNRCFNYTVIEEPFRSSIIDRLTNKWDLLHQEVPMHARSFVENPFCFDWYIFLSWWMRTHVFGRIFGRMYNPCKLGFDVFLRLAIWIVIIKLITPIQSGHYLFCISHSEKGLEINRWSVVPVSTLLTKITLTKKQFPSNATSFNFWDRIWLILFYFKAPSLNAWLSLNYRPDLYLLTCLYCSMESSGWCVFVGKKICWD